MLVHAGKYKTEDRLKI